MPVKVGDLEAYIDIRKLVETVAAEWRSITAAVVLAGALAVAVNLTRATTYEATAHVTVSAPGILFQPDSRHSAQFRVPSTSGLTGLAQSDGVLRQVLESSDLEALEVANLEVGDLRETSRVRASDTLLLLTVEAPGSKAAAAIANTWARVLSGRINELYSPASTEEESLRRLVDSAFLKWQAAEQGLAKYSIENPQASIRHRMNGLENVLTGYPEIDQSLALVQQDVRILQMELQAREPGAPATDGDEMRVMVLAARSSSSTTLLLSNIFTGGSAGTTVQLDQESGESRTTRELVTILSNLNSSLLEQRQSLAQGISEIETQVTTLDRRLNQIDAERTQLIMERNITQEFYLSLARRAQAEGTDLQMLQSVARVASTASVPAGSTAPGAVAVATIGAALGLFLGISWAIIKDRWFGPSRLPGTLTS